MNKFSIEQLKQVTDIYFHASCPDGTSAAFICAAAFKEINLTPEFHSLQYGTEKMSKLEPKPGQLFVDITPSKERWEEWKVVNPIVLDHHETVQYVTEGLGGVYATNEAHSGAQLALEEVMLPIIDFMPVMTQSDEDALENWKELADRSMIRDTWKKDHPNWDAACQIAMSMLFMGSKGLIAKAQEYGLHALERVDIEHLYEIGAQVVANDKRRIETLSKGAEFKGREEGFELPKISFFNCTEKIISDTANSLITNNECNVSVGYFYLFEDGALRLQVSIRTDGSISARKIAESLGGGGHERAAGFRMSGGTSPKELYDIIFGAIFND